MTKSLIEKDIEGLKILSKLVAQEENISEQELKKLAAFLKSVIGNNELNALLINLDHEEKNTHGFHDEALIIIIALSFRTRFINQIPDDLFDRSSSIYDKLIKKEKLSETDKLSFAEYAKILELGYLLDDLLFFEKHGILKLDPELEKLNQRARHGKNIDNFLSKKQLKKQWRHAIRFLMRKVISPFMEYFTDMRDSKVVIFNLPETKQSFGKKKKT